MMFDFSAHAKSGSASFFRHSSQGAGRVLREYLRQRGNHESGASVVRHASRELLRYVAHQLRPHLDQSFRLAVQSGDVEALVAAAVAVFNYFNRLAKAPKAKGRRPQNPASIELSQSGG